MRNVYLPEIIKYTRHQKEQQVERYHYRSNNIDVGDPTGSHHAICGTTNRRRCHTETIEAKVE